MVEIETKLCKRCGICIELCPKKVFESDDMGVPFITKADACSKCLFCELHCPEYAIEIKNNGKESNG